MRSAWCTLSFSKLLCENEAALMAIGDAPQSAIIRYREVKEMVADPAGELLDQPIVAIGNDRGDLHWMFPFLHFLRSS